MSSRRIFLKQTLATLALASIAPEEIFAATKSVKITILHTNDMHSRIEAFPNDGRLNGGMGGMAQRATLIKQIRKQEENILLLDAGDIFQGTPYFNYFGGEVEYKIMSQMGYDAATLGNHDFDNGMVGLQKMLPNAKFPFLIANYDFSKTIFKNQFQPYKIFKKQGIKIGVFGLGIELKGLVPEKLYEGTVHINPIEVAKEIVQELKQQKCDLIICLSHLGYKYEQENKISDHDLATQVSDIDLIIGGHTHTFLDKPTEIIAKDGHKTLIHQVGWAGIRLGRIDYVFNEKGKKTAIQGTSLEIREQLKG
jgi:5'-nucleotidase